MVAHPNLKGGKRKLSHKTRVYCHLPFQKFQELAGVDFRGKKLSFRPKNGFFDVFKHQCTKSLRNFTLALRWCSNLQDICPFEVKRCANYKRGNFFRKKFRFWARKRQKFGFLRVFIHHCTKSLRNFTVLLRWYSNLQVSCLFNQARCASKKWTTLAEEEKVLGQKTSNKKVFWGFHTLLH